MIGVEKKMTKAEKIKAAMDRVRPVLDRFVGEKRSRPVKAESTVWYWDRQYTRLSKDRWTYSGDNKKFTLSAYPLPYYWEPPSRRDRNSITRALRALSLLKLVSTEDAETVRLYFVDLDREQDRRESLSELRRLAKRAGARVVMPRV